MLKKWEAVLFLPEIIHMLGMTMFAGSKTIFGKSLGVCRHFDKENNDKLFNFM